MGTVISKVVGCVKPDEHGRKLFRFSAITPQEGGKDHEVFICDEDQTRFVEKVLDFLEHFTGSIGKLQNITRVSKKKGYQINSGGIDRMEKLPPGVYDTISHAISECNKRNKAAVAA